MKVVFFDAYNLIYRAKHSTPPYLKDSDDGIVYTFFRSFAALYRRLAPDLSFFVIEGTPVQRLKLHPEYKGTRKREIDISFSRQKNEIIELIAEAFPVSVVRHPDFECDDVIGHLVHQYPHPNTCVVASTDTDFLQLANSCDNFSQYDPIRKIYKDLPTFNYVGWKALRGDASDNISGFKGIGDKRALKLISSDDVLEEFLDKPGNRERYEKNLELISFHDVSKKQEGITFSPAVGNWDYIKSIFSTKGFSSITKEGSWEKFVNSFGGNNGTT